MVNMHNTSVHTGMSYAVANHSHTLALVLPISDTMSAVV